MGSLVCGSGIVAIGTHLFPSTRGFVHFRFSDYATLTVLGVMVACVAWPAVTTISSASRWLFSRLAIVVTLGSLLPDAALLVLGDPVKDVAILVVMHLAIALVTYNALVHLAPPERATQRRSLEY
ncbi:MAG: hypothetical protein ACYDGN_02005 [Acidimicrobiales bacterium]